MITVLVAVLVVVGVVCTWVSVVGLLVTHGVFDRLHYVGPAGMGAVCVAAAVIVDDPGGAVAVQAAVVGVFVVIVSPVLVHATARAARIAGRGAWQRGDDEAIGSVPDGQEPT